MIAFVGTKMKLIFVPLLTSLKHALVWRKIPAVARLTVFISLFVKDFITILSPALTYKYNVHCFPPWNPSGTRPSKLAAYRRTLRCKIARNVLFQKISIVFPTEGFHWALGFETSTLRNFQTIFNGKGMDICWNCTISLPTACPL